nr:hypothetical protein [Tanacetum cinerariifolium]
MRPQGELNDRAIGLTGAGPEQASVRFDDRATDRQPHSQASGLGAAERREHLLLRMGTSDTRRAHHRSKLSAGCF